MRKVNVYSCSWESSTSCKVIEWSKRLSILSNQCSRTVIPSLFTDPVSMLNAFWTSWPTKCSEKYLLVSLFSIFYIFLKNRCAFLNQASHPSIFRSLCPFASFWSKTNGKRPVLCLSSPASHLSCSLISLSSSLSSPVILVSVARPPLFHSTHTHSPKTRLSYPQKNSVKWTCLRSKDLIESSELWSPVSSVWETRWSSFAFPLFLFSRSFILRVFVFCYPSC